MAFSNNKSSGLRCFSLSFLSTAAKKYGNVGLGRIETLISRQYEKKVVIALEADFEILINYNKRATFEIVLECQVSKAIQGSVTCAKFRSRASEQVELPVSNSSSNRNISSTSNLSAFVSSSVPLFIPCVSLVSPLFLLEVLLQPLENKRCVSISNSDELFLVLAIDVIGTSFSDPFDRQI